MRITFRVSAARSDGFMRLPLLAHPGEEYRAADGACDTAKVRAELGKLRSVQFSSDDGPAAIMLAVEILDRLRIALDRFGRVAKPENSADATASEERMERGRFATVRLDLRYGLGGYRVALRVSSPNAVPVKGAVDFAATLAQILADNIVAIRDDVRGDLDGKTAPDGVDVAFRLVEGEGCEGVFAKAEKRNAHALLVRELRGKYAACERRHDCRTREELKLCSPCKFDCECFRDGGVCAYEDIINGKEN